LSGMEPDEFVQIVRSNDVTAMINMPGIGKKTAERLIIEMRDRLKDWGAIESLKSGLSREEAPTSITRDAETALVSLGYKPQQAARAIAMVMKENNDITDSEELIRYALKSMA